jgi:SAM-dependent methyltransferase
MTDMAPYFAGKVLYGDDFGAEQVADWYRDEAEGYADLGARNAGDYSYGYHALNARHGFRHLPPGPFRRLLGFGSAYGHELQPVLPGVEHVTVVDPSDAFCRSDVLGTPATYVKPAIDGTLPLATAEFDLATCLGVLHHIPNVSFVLGELARVMRPGGFLLLREPIISMGDWRQPRTGLTKRERGIPLHLLRAFADQSGFDTVHENLCAFSLTTRLFRWQKTPPYNSPFAVAVDHWLCRAFAWNLNYHPSNTLQRVRPSSVFLVLRRRG